MQKGGGAYLTENASAEVVAHFLIPTEYLVQSWEHEELATRRTTHICSFYGGPRRKHVFSDKAHRSKAAGLLPRQCAMCSGRHWLHRQFMTSPISIVGMHILFDLPHLLRLDGRSVLPAKP